MWKTRMSFGRTLLLAGLLCGIYGCAAEAQPQSYSAALQGAGGAASDLDRDFDEGGDLDDDVDERNDDADDHDDVRQLTELPAAVQATAQAEVGAGTITEIDRDRGPTGIEYEVDFTRDGAEYEVVIAEDGTKLRSSLD